MIHNMVGGGGGKLFAVIAVTYPEGSICTCSDGTKTMKAKDTSGKALFNVTVGEWTVTATDGSSTTSQAVSITTEGQSESVTLTYELVLFNNGDYAAETGGFSRVSNNKLYSYSRRQTDVLEEYGKWSTNNAINLAGYNTLHFMVASGAYGVGDEDQVDAACVKVGLSTAKESTSFAASKNVSNGAFTEYTLSLSGNQGSYYIVGYTDGGDWTSVVKTTTCYISKLWLT